MRNILQNGRRQLIGVEGRNCWRIVRPGRVAFLVDASAYFRHLRAAILRARRSIHIIGWDFDTRVELVRGEDADDGAPTRLGPLLNHVASRRRRLHVYVQVWDFATIFAFEREPLLLFKLGWKRHRRVHFRYDAKHPFGASQHQKIVVIDDAIAFSGGLDVTSCRWDTPQHLPDDERRCDAGNRVYGPFHDIQIAVDGEAAAALGDLARERWRAVSRRRPVRLDPAAPGEAADPWPDDLSPDLTDARVLIARTHPPFARTPAVREVERLFVDSIAVARRSIYIENQYFTSPVIADALAARLQEPAGPEVVLVLRLSCSGWLEEGTMGSCRRTVLRRLKEADVGGRLRIVAPMVETVDVNVHAKVTIVDDDFARIGSANLTNRSLGLDTECDLAVEAEDAAGRAAIAAFRDRLLAEHLGVRPAAVRRATTGSAGSLCAAVDALGSGARTLAPIDTDVEPPSDALRSMLDYADPERPLAGTMLIEKFLPEIQEERRARRSILLVAALAAAVAFLVWLATGIEPAVLEDTGWLGRVESVPLPALVVPLAMVAASLLFIPLNLLFVAVAFVFGFFPGVLYAAGGLLASSVAGYGAGRVIGRNTVRFLVGTRGNALSRKLPQASRDAKRFAIVRVLPVATASVVNLVCGASRLRLRTFVLGTLLGVVPALLVFSILGSLLRAAVERRGAAEIVWFAAFGLLVIGFSGWLGRYVGDHVHRGKVEG